MPQFISKDELNNTVSSRNQLPESLYVTFENLSSNNSKRILFIGNSITRHAPKPDIGWTLDCGMAASCKQKDYVHVVISSVLENDPDAGFCITQGAVWERDFDCDLAKNFSSAQDFAADIIVYRLGENIPNEGLTKERYASAMDNLFAFPTKKNPDARIIYCTNFWRNELKDDTVIEYAKSKDEKAIFLGDLGDKDENKAIGLFEHPGVAAHPGDLGMRRIADRILEVL